MSLITDDFLEAQKVLNTFIEDKSKLQSIETAGKIMVDALKSGGKIISCGNGGSMSDAMHFAEELTGRFRENRPGIAAISISDPSHISCVANDFGYDYIFSRFIESMGNKGDVLLAISTSGNSVNVLNAARIAKEKKMKVIALTGKTGGKLASECDLEIRVEHLAYADRIQEIHIKIIHSLIHYIEKNIVSEI